MQNFRPEQPEPPSRADGNDYHLIAPTEKQLIYARQIALRIDVRLPPEVRNDRRKLSAWIDENRTRAAESRFASYPSSRQVAFAERIARIKRRHVPPECFHDRQMMSKWIDGNR